ncbi:hypothetical protein SLA2020_222960 [Shorea laevis]
MIQELKRVGEERAVSGGKGGDDVADTWVVDGRPYGRADFPPDVFFCREVVQLGGHASNSDQSGTVESGENMGLDNVGMNGDKVAEAVPPP